MNALSIYKSSAGSGKTYTLVREYLKLVLPYPTNFRHVLAITFTNKATDEMKSRILLALIELAENRNKLLAQELTGESSLSKLNIQEQAQKCLDFILHHYGDFAVTTIDSFFNSIVKSLALEMKLPLRFEIELDAEFINDDITKRLLLDIGKDEKLTAWLQSFAFDKMDEDRGWKIKDEIKKISRQLFKEEFYKQESTVETDYTGLTEILKTARKKFEQQARSSGEQFVSLISKNGITVDHFAYGKSGVANFLTKLSRNDLKPDDYIPGVRALAAAENIDAWQTKSKLNEAVTALVRASLHPLLNNYIRFYNEHYTHYCSAVEVLKLIYVAGLVDYLKKHFRDYRDEHNLITIADANLLIKNFVSANDTPFVFEKTGNKFRHFLLDEFQDTSDIQWKNLLPLITNSLASGNSALIVGDVKQAIYRWRGGNMNLLQSEIRNDLAMYSALITEKNLNINYRSTREIIDFNNAFFGWLPKVISELEHADDKLIAAAYQLGEVIQLTPEKIKTNGYVNISFIDEKEMAEIDEDAKWKQESLDRLIPNINDLLNDGYTFGDIAILVRTKFEGNDIARYLYNHGIDKIISSDSLLIDKAPQVQFIINAICYLFDQKNILVRKEMLYFIAKKGIAATELHQLFSSIDFENDSLFKTYLPTSYFKLSKYFLQLPIYDLAEQLIMLFDLNKTADAYLQRLLDVILEYSEKNSHDPLSFIHWWDENAQRKGFSVVTPEQSDAITIITIHKSKGLQYPVVLMPMCEWKLKPKAGELMWVSCDEEPFNILRNIPVNFSKSLANTYFSEEYIKEIQLNYLDNLNLLYVAFTRAAERLYITTPLLKSANAPTQLSQLIQMVVKRNTDWNNHYNESENILALGDKIKKERNKAKVEIIDFFHPAAMLLPAFPISAWQNRLGIKTSKEYFSASIEFGNIVHKTLSFIITENDLEQALNKTKNLFILNETTLAKVKNSIIKILEVSKPLNWFTGKYAVRNESEIVFPEPSLVSPPTIFRPDRLMFNENETVILDYKTGAQNKSYHRQLNEYKTVLQSAGFKSVNAFLLYSEDCKVVMVED